MLNSVTKFFVHEPIPSIDDGMVRGGFEWGHKFYEFWYDPETDHVALERRDSGRSSTAVPDHQLKFAKDQVRKRLKKGKP